MLTCVVQISKVRGLRSDYCGVSQHTLDVPFKSQVKGFEVLCVQLPLIYEQSKQRTDTAVATWLTPLETLGRGEASVQNWKLAMRTAWGLRDWKDWENPGSWFPPGSCCHCVVFYELCYGVDKDGDKCGTQIRMD